MRQFTLGIAVYACLCASLIIPVHGLTIRDDRTQSQYVALADSEPYVMGGMVYSSSEIGSGTLISPHWVLTAGHVVDTSGAVTQTFITTYGYGYDASPTRRYVDPNADIGLLYLPETAYEIYNHRDFTYPTLYTSSLGSELGQSCVIEGAGDTGTGSAGITTGPGTIMAGTNVVSDINPNVLFVDFTNPSTGQATDLEAGPSYGDSGGGLFITKNGVTYLAGVQSFGYANDGDFDSSYGDGGGYVRVSSQLAWIQSIIGIPGDLNADGLVNVADYGILKAHWYQSVPAGTDGDLNSDGFVNLDDFKLFKADFQASGAGTDALLTANLPESSTQLLAMAMSPVLAVLLWKRVLSRKLQMHSVS